MWADGVLYKIGEDSRLKSKHECGVSINSVTAGRKGSYCAMLENRRLRFFDSEEDFEDEMQIT